MSDGERAYLIMHVLIRGLVQGVGYRAWVERLALENGLEGWVRNRRDGSVEAVFAGAGAAVQAAVERCRRGPSDARVGEVKAGEGSRDLLNRRRAGERFSVLPTA